MFLGKWNSDNSYYLYEQIKNSILPSDGCSCIHLGWGCSPVGLGIAGSTQSPRVCLGAGGILGWSFAQPHCMGCSDPSNTSHLMWFGGRRTKAFPQPHCTTWVLMAILPCWDAGGWIWSFHAVGGGDLSRAKLLSKALQSLLWCWSKPLGPAVAAAPTHSAL